MLVPVLSDPPARCRLRAPGQDNPILGYARVDQPPSDAVLGPIVLHPELTFAQVYVEEWRVNAPLSNMPEFASAFHCKPGDSMVRPGEVVPHIW